MALRCPETTYRFHRLQEPLPWGTLHTREFAPGKLKLEHRALSLLDFSLPRF